MQENHLQIQLYNYSTEKLSDFLVSENNQIETDIESFQYFCLG